MLETDSLKVDDAGLMLGVRRLRMLLSRVAEFGGRRNKHVRDLEISDGLTGLDFGVSKRYLGQREKTLAKTT